jgi:hypothetical protein
MSASFHAVFKRGLAPSRGQSDCSENRPCNRFFWAAGADIRPPLEVVPDNAAANLRRLRDTARAIAAPHEEKSPMLYRGHMR